MAGASTRCVHAWEIMACSGIDGIIEELGARLRHRLGDPAGRVPYHLFRTTDWDRRRRVQTEGNVSPESFDPRLPNRDFALAYIPVSIWTFRRLIAALVRAGVRQREFTLLDYGCGKGRAILMGVEAGFRQVVGVEFNPELGRLADENLRNYRGRRGVALVHHGDAAAYPIPLGPVVFFLFNPFVGPVLEAVADNIRHSFAQDPRPMYIAYSTPQQVSPFGRGTPFRLVESDPDYEIYHLAREAPGTAQTR
jgi:SAM-dependent methyltransferase